MRSALPRLAGLVLAALLAACGGSGSPPPPPLVWTWVPIAGSICNDGSPTGIGVETSATPGANVIVFLDGGGACWDYFTCYVARSATPGPFGQAQFDAKVQGGLTGTLFDRAAPGNPYKDFTFVFVPYCTGDVHSGNTDQPYYSPTVLWHHHGRANVANAFQYLAGTLPAPAKVVVAGSSAGGFGSLHAYKQAKGAWPSAKAYLVDDSGPPLPNIPAGEVAAWIASWDLGTAINDVCGAPCGGTSTTPPTTMAPIIPELAKANPGDRFALLSSTADTTIEGFFFDPVTFLPMSPTVFYAGLTSLVGSIEAVGPPANAHAFVVTGTSHTMLGSPGTFTAGIGPQATGLFDWLSKQVTDDATWSAAKPF